MKLIELVYSYIDHKQSSGMRFHSEVSILKAFCRTMGDVDIDTITPGKVLSFIAGQGPVTSFWHQKHIILRGFYSFTISRGYTKASPLPSVLPKRPPPLTPYIYTIEELRKFLAATEKLQTPNSPLQDVTFRTLFLLLYGTGMRISEALALTLADVDIAERLLTVRDTKFFKTRLVPVGPKLTGQLAVYAKQRCRLPLPSGEASAFFATRTGNRLSYERASRLFRKVRKLAGIKREVGSRYQPRLHDLRHTAAVHRIVAWYQTGADVQRLLPQLATYLGHIEVQSTQRYLSMTADLLNEANRRFECYAQQGEAHYE